MRASVCVLQMLLDNNIDPLPSYFTLKNVLSYISEGFLTDALSPFESLDTTKDFFQKPTSLRFFSKLLRKLFSVSFVV